MRAVDRFPGTAAHRLHWTDRHPLLVRFLLVAGACAWLSLVV